VAAGGSLSMRFKRVNLPVSHTRLDFHGSPGRKLHSFVAIFDPY